MIKKLFLNLKILFEKYYYIDCIKCSKRGVRFSHEEHFTPGSPNVYYCKFCKEYFI